MTRWTYLLAGVAAMALCAQSVAKEQPAPGEPVTWPAASNTADSMSGDVVYLPNSLTFADGTSLAMTAVANAPAPWAMFSSGSGGDGEIYKLESPADPELLNGNKLCGMPGQPVTHVMIAPNPKAMKWSWGYSRAKTRQRRNPSHARHTATNSDAFLGQRDGLSQFKIGASRPRF